MAKIISMISGKGGTGKSTIAASLSLSLASLGYSVLAIDMDIGLRSLDLLMGLENQVVFDIGDVLGNRCRLENAMTAHPRYKYLKLLCAPSDIQNDFHISDVIVLIKKASKHFDYVIIDSPAGIGISIIMVKALADLAAIVINPDIITLRDARKTVDTLLSNCKKPCRLIINKVSRETMCASGIRDLDEIIDIVGIPLLTVIPEDPFINKTCSEAPKNKRRDSFTQKIIDAAARRITGEYVPILMKTI